MNLANVITLLRFPLLGFVIILLYFGGTVGLVLDLFFVAVLILMDTLDGIVARRRHEETLAGSMLDIATDRAVEIVLWMAFAHRGLIPLAIPVIVILRGALTDSIREAALRQGESPHSMMQTPVGRWLVASRIMRSSYGAIKAAAFLLLTLALALQTGGAAIAERVGMAGLIAAWIAVILCLLRGLPVIVEASNVLLRAPTRGAAPYVSRRSHE